MIKHPVFLVIYYLDKLIHKLGYHPTTYSRVWFCEHAEDRLTEIAFAHENKDNCFWCRRYYGRENV